MAWSRRGTRGGGARPTLFAPNTLKSPLNWPKKSWGRAPEPPALPHFLNPGSAPVEIWIWMIVPVLALTYIYHGDTISMHICRHILLIFKVIRCNTIYYAITKD